MAIQWYPGHMHKAQKEMKQVIARMDVIIEVIDARIPYSSTNPVIAELSNFKGLVCPVIKLMNKADLADPEISALWQQHFELNQNTRALALIANQNFTSEKRKIIELIKKMVPTKATADKPVNAMIMGIPNVGKSTIINALAERKIAKVGNEPAVTQRQQRIDLEDNIILYDTPGILWPKIENENSAYRLAITGAIKDTALSYDEVAFYLVEYLQSAYPELLSTHYGLDENQFAAQAEVIDIIEAIGRKRGSLKAGGRIDIDKVSKLIVHEYRQAVLGQISLETPDMVAVELIEVEEKIRLKEEQKQARKQAFKKRS